MGLGPGWAFMFSHDVKIGDKNSGCGDFEVFSELDL